MKISLPIFAGLICLAAALASHAQTPLPLGKSGPATGLPADATSGDALLHRVVAAVDAQASIAAKVRHRVDVMGLPVMGSGVYLQQGRGAQRKLRFELTLQTTPDASNLRQVCDGKNFWMFEGYGAHQSLGRIDLERLQRAQPKSQSPAPPPIAWMGLGGLPKLLGGIEGAFHFQPVAESRLDTLRVWTIEGVWKRDRLAALLPAQKAAIDAGGAVDTTKLSPNLPDRVILHVGCDDLFPYRLEYWRALAPGKPDAEAAQQPVERGKLMVVMELYEVQLGGAIDPRHFAYDPGALVPVDLTQSYLDKFGLQDAIPVGAKGKAPPRR